MIEGIDGNVASKMLSQPEMQSALEAAQQAATAQAKEKVKEQFMAIFYKEILKQTFKPSFGLGEEENGPSMFVTFGSDVLVDKLAADLATNKAYSIDNIGAAGTQR